MSMYIEHPGAYQAAIERKMRKACYEKFITKFIPAHPEVDWVAARASRNTFIREMIAGGEKWGKLSDKQLTTITTSLQRDIDWKAGRDKAQVEYRESLIAQGVTAPEGRKEVTGLVKSLKWVDSNYGSTQKMLVELTDGAKVWCSVPVDLEGIQVGDMIQFTASFTLSEKDQTFSFGKRPAKAHTITRVEVEA